MNEELMKVRDALRDAQYSPEIDDRDRDVMGASIGMLERLPPGMSIPQMTAACGMALTTAADVLPERRLTILGAMSIGLFGALRQHPELIPDVLAAADFDAVPIESVDDPQRAADSDAAVKARHPDIAAIRASICSDLDAGPPQLDAGDVPYAEEALRVLDALPEQAEAEPFLPALVGILSSAADVLPHLRPVIVMSLLKTVTALVRKYPVDGVELHVFAKADDLDPPPNTLRH